MTKEKEKRQAGNDEDDVMPQDQIFLVFFKDGSIAIDRVGRLQNFNQALVEQAFRVPEETALYEISGFFARGMKEIPAKWKQVK